MAGLEQGEVTEGELTLEELLGEVAPELVVQQEAEGEGDDVDDEVVEVQRVLSTAAAWNSGNQFMQFMAQHSGQFSTGEVKAVSKLLDKVVAYKQQSSRQMGITHFFAADVMTVMTRMQAQRGRAV